MSAYERLTALGIDLPTPAAPAAAYSTFAHLGRTLHLSGHLSRQEGKIWKGRCGDDLATEDGRAAARAVAIDLLATLQLAAGSLEKIERLVKLTVMVSSTKEFCDQHLVANGASEILSEVFGTPHARSAFGVAQLPLGACVEIELIAALKE